MPQSNNTPYLTLTDFVNKLNLLKLEHNCGDFAITISSFSTIGVRYCPETKEIKITIGDIYRYNSNLTQSPEIVHLDSISRYNWRI